jgi:hypothetical protein
LFEPAKQKGLPSTSNVALGSNSLSGAAAGRMWGEAQARLHVAASQA